MIQSVSNKVEERFLESAEWCWAPGTGFAMLTMDIHILPYRLETAWKNVSVSHVLLDEWDFGFPAHLVKSEDLHTEILDHASRENAMVIWRTLPYEADGRINTRFTMFRRSFITCEPVNNDGRRMCYWCGKSTQRIQGFHSCYDICPNCKK